MFKRLGGLSGRLLIILALLGLFITPGMARSLEAQKNADKPNIPDYAKPKKVSPEVRDIFGDGLSEQEFLALSNGKVRSESDDKKDDTVIVILEMEQDPLADVYAEKLAGSTNMAADLQVVYVDSLNRAQETVALNIESAGGDVIDRYTKAYNGMLVRLPANKLEITRQMAGVKDIHPAPVHVPALENSVPFIGATDVISDTGYDGSGITIAIIDTGIDYTHAAFGGSGDPNDYDSNDPDIKESGTFPTAKVIGGYDFAGGKYDFDCSAADEIDGKCSTIPQPDPDPLDGDGHGTHVASTAAGLEVAGSIGAGVAPGAELYALKVFGEPAGSTNLTISAIEWAMDPNRDGDLSDRVDVINMSIGSDFGPASDVDPVIVATNNASKIGIVVVAAAGNAGDTKYITGSPASADSAISVAASTTGYINGPTITVVDTEIFTNTNIIYQPSSFSAGGQFTETLTAELYYAGNLSGVTDDELCSKDGPAPVALDGKLALIQRGSCGFSVKVNNAASLGAVGAMVFNSEEGGNSRIIMGGDEVTIPAGFIAHDDGVSLVNDTGEDTFVSAEDVLSTVEDRYSEADTLASFSSRGPRGYDSVLKPDITAPGVSIKAAEMGGGTTGVVFNGTSMAAPHVAGVAALVREAHPDWNPELVKAALMNTAVDLADDESAELPRQGSGRVDAYEAVTSDVLAIGSGGFVSLNWGVIPIYNNVYVDQKTITVQNTFTSTKVFSVTSSLAENSNSTGFTLSVPLTIEVKGSPGFAYVPVDLTVDGSQVSSEFYTLEEYFGFVEFTNVDDSQEVLRVPFYAVPQPYSELMLTGSSLSAIYGTVDIEHNGPITSSLVAYPLYVIDDNEPAQGDEADIRYVGMDYYGYDNDGPIISLAIDVYGSWHTPQNLFAEFDLYLNVDQDPYEIPEYRVFNWNYGAATGSSDNDEWVIVKVDLATNIYYLGSNYTILTDYNSGYMKWWLPALLYDLDPAVDTDFVFQLIGKDNSYFSDPNEDETDKIYFDYARAPFLFSFTNDSPGPAIPDSRLNFWVDDSSGYIDSDPLGLMIVDYRGVPGVGQAYAHTFLIDKPYNIWTPLNYK